MKELIRLLKFILICSAPIWFNSCGSSTSASAEGNLAYLYLNGGSALNPHISIHHLNEDSSRVDFQIERSELLYMKGSDEKLFKSRITLIYQVLGDANIIVDSGRVLVIDRKNSTENGAIRSSFFIRRNSSNQREKVALVVRDLNRKYDSYFEQILNDDQLASRQYFEWRDLKGRLQFSPFIQGDQGLRVRYLPKDTLLYVRYYQRDFPIAIPPYAKADESSFDFKEDSLFLVSTLDTIYLSAHGIYHFQVDTSLNEGFTLFRFEQGHPFVLNKGQLAPPMRYISTKKEYAKFTTPISADSVKLEVDKFWINAAGSLERGQELVAAYYSRVEIANQKFSSYLEGWKTDRGIIYIIYGPPTEVYRDNDVETWIYGDRNSILSYIFNFVRVENPFTENDFALNRLSDYRYGWGQAVGAWRNGRIYGVRDIQREQNARDAQLRQQRASPTIWY